MREEFLWRQIARLLPIEDRLGNIRREIAEADEAREVGPADTFPLGECSKGDAFALGEAALNRRALRSSFTNRALGFAVANGSVPSVTILISRPARRSRTGTDRSSVSPPPCLAMV